MLPLVAIPTAALWIIAVILAFFDPGPIAGVSHHTYTGALFILALVLTIVAFVIAQRAEKPGGGRVNSFALPLLLSITYTFEGWHVLVGLLIVVWVWAFTRKDEGSGYFRGLNTGFAFAAALVFTLGVGITAIVAYATK